MSKLTVIVPTRGRPEAIVPMLESFYRTCSLPGTTVVFAVDGNDSKLPRYSSKILDAREMGGSVYRHVAPLLKPLSFTDDGPPASENFELVTTYFPQVRWLRITHGGESSMVAALNTAARMVIEHGGPDDFIGFMGDDHRPRTIGWDAAYVNALSEPGVAIVYGNDLIQGERLPTQCAMRADVIDALGFMCPPQLRHLFVDDYWLALGKETDCIQYLPDVTVEHCHPVAGTAPNDEGYARVNSGESYRRDAMAFSAYRSMGNIELDAMIVRRVLS
jgi:hypothetical protein